MAGAAAGAEACANAGRAGIIAAPAASASAARLAALYRMNFGTLAAVGMAGEEAGEDTGEITAEVAWAAAGRGLTIMTGF
ncbi:hypothetical protein D3C79_1031210 [compost metagenome]